MVAGESERNITGLGLKVGEPAINPTPQNIQNELSSIYAEGLM